MKRTRMNGTEIWRDSTESLSCYSKDRFEPKALNLLSPVDF